MDTTRGQQQRRAVWRPWPDPSPGTRWSIWLVLLVGSLGALCLLGPVAPGWVAVAAKAATSDPARALADGLEAFRRGDLEGAAAQWQAAARGYAAATQGHAHSVALTHLAHAYAALGHYRQAAASLQTALQLAEDTPDRAQQARILGALSDIALTSGDTAEATQRVREALALAGDLDNTDLAATLAYTRGALLMADQQWAAAQEAYQASAHWAQQAHQLGTAGRALAHAALAAERDTPDAAGADAARRGSGGPPAGGALP